MKSIGLCMIVKNEARIITRCLESVRPLIDYALIEDTGSTDGTQEVIRGWLTQHNVAGEVIEEPWRDFAYNRTHVMEALRKVGSVDYALVIDADDTLDIDAGFDAHAFKAQMTHDLYDVPVRHGRIAHHRPQLFSNRLPFSFKGVVHEYLEAPPGPLSRDTAKGFAICATTGGARSANPRKYQDDAAVLERALATETDPFLISRYTFYLAQSCHDCGENEKALANYLKRAEQGYWAEEIFCSLYRAGRIKETLGHPPEDVIATFLRASDVSAARGEALHAAARFCRSLGRSEEGFQYAKRGAEKPLPATGLFIERWIYDYGLLDEIGINGYWSGHYREALDACLKLLGSKGLPGDQRERIMKNAQFSLAKLPGDPNPAGFHPKGLSPGQHALEPPRDLRSALPEKPPKILLAILAKQKEISLPLYLRCIEALDYPKSSIVVYIRTNNNTDRTGAMLAEWVEQVRGEYAAIEMDASDVAERVQDFDVHEWNAIRFSVLAKIRADSLLKTLEYGCDFYFTADIDNFIRPCTLRELVTLNLPIVAPLLRSVDPRALYLNCHVDIDANGYYRGCDEYYAIFNQSVVGVFELPVVHCTYLIRAGCIPALAYADGTPRHEYVIFSDVARKAGIPQYYDNRQVYGYLTLKEEAEAAMKLIGPEIDATLSAKRATAALLSEPTKTMSEATSSDRIPELQFSRLMEWRTSPEAQSSAEAAHFVDFCLTYPGKTKAQNFQDFFVLHQLGAKRGGFFVEFGAGDGDYLSNSIMLEQQFSWNGILAEPARCNTEKLRRTRTCAIDERCVWRSSGQRLAFVETKEPELSTISDFIHSDMNAAHRLPGRRYEVVSVSLNELLSEHNAPRRIDYLSIDTEGSEYEILQAFDFEKYDVGVLTVEHNYSSKRDDVFKLLSSKGFERKFPFFSNVDDWYVRL